MPKVIHTKSRLHNKPNKPCRVLSTRLALPVSFLIVLSFLYINIYVGNALMNSSAVTENHEVIVQDNNTLGIEFVDNEGNVTADPTRIEITPTADGVFNSGDVNVRVHTNSDNGYTLTMSATTTSLSGSVADSGHTIPTLLAATSEANFPNNYWGYKRTSSSIADTLYNPMVANVNIPVSTYGSTTNGEISKVNFGVKLDNLTPSDSYSINIAFAAVTNIAPNLYYMQDATSTSLAAAMPSVGDTTVLYDRRDNKEYTIAKLADGKYWMTKNLDLDGGTPLYSSDSDVPAGYDVEPYYTLPASSESGFNDNTVAYVYNSPNKTDSCGSGCYSYYSFNAATAMSAENVASNNTDAPYSICPKNWKLPTTRTTAPNNSDFYQLAVAYGMSSADISQDTPNFYNQAGPGTTANFILSGNYYSSSFHSGDGEYWSSTTVDNRYMAVVMHFANNDIYSYGRQERKTGSAVRCLFDATMQNFSQEDADAMALHQEEILVDARDGQNYTVAKLKDGNVWMTKNLNLAGGTTITSADSDVVENYTLPASSTTGFDNDGAEYAYVYNSGNNDDSFCNETNKQPCYSYYSYNAATAMSGASINTDNTDAPYSICPAGWELPTSRSTLELAKTSSDFYQMAIHYGLKDSVVNEDPDNDGITFCTLGGDCGTNTVPRFLRAGYYTGSTFFNGGTAGGYWSSTASSSTGAHNLHFYSSNVYSADNSARRIVLSVRCLLRTE